METLIFVLQIFSCLFLIGLILIQHGQGSEMGAAFGGASQTVFGSRGPATFLNKFTIIIAVMFLGSSIFLAQAARHKTAASVVDEAKKLEAQEQKIDQGLTIEEEKAPAEEVDKNAPVEEETK